MAKKSPILYSVSKTFLWFAVVSIVLTGSLAAVVWLDHAREWKDWQKKFATLKLEKIKGELKEAEQKIDKNKLDALREQIKKAEGDFRAPQKDYDALKKEIESLGTRAVKARAAYQDLKQYQDSYKYYLEETRLHHDQKAAEYQAKWDALDPRIKKAKTDLELLEAQQETKERSLSLSFRGSRSFKKN